jgi:anti-sigma factor RsiW
VGRLSDEDRENLVAYHDGALDDKTARALETKLNLDPQARREADEIKRAWELLDYLPRAEASPSFTHRTLEKLALRTTAIALPSWRRWLVDAGWAAAVLLAAVAGTFAAWVIWPQQREAPDVEEQLVRHLRLIDKVHLYDAVEDIEFLRALDAPELFGDQADGGVVR